MSEMPDTSSASRDLMRQAEEILKSTPLIDGHNDWPMEIRTTFGNRIESDAFGPDANLPGHVDLQRLIRGGTGGLFLSAYMSCPDPEDDFSDAVHLDLVRSTLQQIDLIHRLIDKYASHLSLVSSADEILPTFRAGKIPCLIGVEGLHQIGNSASVLRMYARLGVRYVTLTHVRNNLFADSANSTIPKHHGLSEIGRRMVAEMNRIGMIIDLSHVGEETMHQVLKLSAAPVLFTHSNARGLHDNVRNVPDSCLDELKLNNGVCMVTLVPHFVHADVSQATEKHVVDHIEYIAERIGYDHIGIGTDFDGTAKIVTGVRDAGELPALVVDMLRRGIEPWNIAKVLGLNVIRVLKDVESVAAAKKDEPALEDEIACETH